jgi:endonuclease G
VNRNIKRLLLYLSVFCLSAFLLDGVRAQKTKSVIYLEHPALKPGETITSHTGFALCYQETYEQPSWVAYELTAKKTISVTSRTNKFIPDPTIRTGSATQADYARSGYDRGHLAPAADMGWSIQTMKESFYFSNMSPQLPTFNRGIWKKTEEQVRSWAREYGTLYIATGPVLENGLPVIGPNKVAIPNYYYKALLRCLPSDTNAVAILMPHAASSIPLTDFFVSIDSLEQITGIDFFHNLPDEVERRIEKRNTPDEWPLVKNNAGSSAPVKEKTQSNNNVNVQCRGITKSGLRCKRKTTNANGRCFSHQ